MSHTLIVVSLPPDITNFELLDMHIEFIQNKSYPIFLFLEGLFKFHRFIALSQPPDIKNLLFFPMHTDLTEL